MKCHSLVALALLSAGLASPLEAQFVRTGGQTTTTCAPTISICDLNWSVQWFRLTGPLVGSYTNAPIVNVGAPVPPWAPNLVGEQQWIGAANNGSVGGGSTRYYFQTTFSAPVSSVLSFGLGWDNRLVGAYVGGTVDLGTGLFIGGTSLLPGVTPATPFAAGKAGFCRDSDGVFPSNQWPNCVLNVALAINANQSNTLTFVVEGDGATDGLLVGTAAGTNQPPVIQVPPPTTSVPEPSTIGMGVMGMAAMFAIRRRGRLA